MKKHINKHVILNYLLIRWIYMFITILMIMPAILNRENIISWLGITYIVFMPSFMNYWFFFYWLFFNNLNLENLSITFISVIHLLNLIITFVIVMFYVNKLWKINKKLPYKVSILFVIWWLISSFYMITQNISV
jgi:hypothetical protein